MPTVVLALGQGELVGCDLQGERIEAGNEQRASKAHRGGVAASGSSRGVCTCCKQICALIPGATPSRTLSSHAQELGERMSEASCERESGGETGWTIGPCVCPPHLSPFLKRQKSENMRFHT